VCDNERCIVLFELRSPIVSGDLEFCLAGRERKPLKEIEANTEQTVRLGRLDLPEVFAGTCNCFCNCLSLDQVVCVSLLKRAVICEVPCASCH
jgi:hypothetical protein